MNEIEEKCPGAYSEDIATFKNQKRSILSFSFSFCHDNDAVTHSTGNGISQDKHAIMKVLLFSEGICIGVRVDGWCKCMAKMAVIRMVLSTINAINFEGVPPREVDSSIQATR